MIVVGTGEGSFSKRRHYKGKKLLKLKLCDFILKLFKFLDQIYVKLIKIIIFIIGFGKKVVKVRCLLTRPGNLVDATSYRAHAGRKRSLTDRWTDGQMDGQTDGRTDGRTDKGSTRPARWVWQKWQSRGNLMMVGFPTMVGIPTIWEEKGGQ